jgi:hypothetical protein
MCILKVYHTLLQGCMILRQPARNVVRKSFRDGGVTGVTGRELELGTQSVAPMPPWQKERVQAAWPLTRIVPESTLPEH